MRIKGDAGEITLLLVERITEGKSAGVVCSIEATSAGFTGNKEEVWFSREAIERFLVELRELNAKWKGDATLAEDGYAKDTRALKCGHQIVQQRLPCFNVKRAALLLTAVVLSVPGCSHKRHSDPIVYVGSESGGRNSNESETGDEHALMTTDGAGSKRTVYRFESPYRARSVTWSPQTKLACVIVAGEGHTQLWSIDLDGTVKHKTDLPSSEDTAPSRPYSSGDVLITTFAESVVRPGPRMGLKRLSLIALDPGSGVKKTTEIAKQLPSQAADLLANYRRNIDADATLSKVRFCYSPLIVTKLANGVKVSEPLDGQLCSFTIQDSKFLTTAVAAHDLIPGHAGSLFVHNFTSAADLGKGTKASIVAPESKQTVSLNLDDMLPGTVRWTPSDRAIGVQKGGLLRVFDVATGKPSANVKMPEGAKDWDWIRDP